MHQAIYETCASLIRANKIANPVTLKSYLPAEVDVAG
jgi:replicative DNA helicase